MEQQTDTEPADPQYALNIAHYLLGSHPHKPHDPEILLEQLTVLFTGKAKWLLRWMIHPERGVLREATFAPSVASCVQWLESRTVGQPREAPEHRLLPPVKHEIEPQEVRDAAADRWNRAKLAFTTKPKRRPAWDDGSQLTPEHQAAIDAYIANPENP